MVGPLHLDTARLYHLKIAEALDEQGMNLLGLAFTGVPPEMLGD